MNEILNFIEENKDNYLNELLEFLRIPSISSVSENKPDVERCANWVKDSLHKAGIEKVEIHPTAGHPIVYAEWMGAGENAPTILIYGHYDVQPVDPLNLWSSPPFEPVIHDGKIWGRGTADDKGQVFTHIKGVEAHFKKNGKLPVNVKFLIEGEEESDSHLDDFIINNAEKLKCDTALISDTEWFAEGLPSICYSLRGITFLEMTLTGPNRDLHSGTFGGAVDNPLNVLCWLVTQLKDRYGRITIPGFYDDVLDLTEEEREGFRQLPFNEKEYMKDLDVKALWGELGYSPLERTWARPSLDLNGMIGGYTGEGAKTVLPSKASAKLSMRLVPNQDPEDITRKVVDYLKKIAPPTVKIEVTPLHGGAPVLVPRDSAGVEAAKIALKQAFGKDPVFMREGGSIPIVGLFETVLHAPSVLLGLGLPSDNIHSPNENFSVDNFFGGIKTSAIFLDEIAKLQKK